MKALHVAASGMSAQQTQLDTIANNMANVSTTGFKRSQGAFEDLLYQEVTSGGQGEILSRSEVGGGVRLAGLTRDHGMGALKQTGDSLHVAINGEGYLVLEDHNGGQAYTRDGTLMVDGEGTLRHVAGHRVAGDIRVPPDAVSITIAQDGTVSARLREDVDDTVIGQIDIARFANPAGLRSLGGNGFAETPASGQPILGTDGETQLMQGFLEGSNVDVAEELVSLIVAQRAYELNSKVIQAADEAMGVAANLKR